MAKYRFSAEQRFGVWHAYDGLCFWCGEPLPFQDTTIDHVLPESLEDEEAKLQSVKAMYGLDDKFNINCYSNWVPAHARCNQRKTDKLFSPSPAMLAILDRVDRRAPYAESAAANATADKQKGRILGRLESALAAATITREEVEQLIAGIQQEPMIANVNVVLHISPHWKIVHESNGLATVTDGKRAGITPVASNPHHTWLCGHCGQYGPWNGVICMSCGKMSDPWD